MAAENVDQPTAATAAMSRRDLLAGAVATTGLALATACSRNAGSAGDATAKGTADQAATGARLPRGAATALIATFDTSGQYAVAGTPQRLAFALGGTDGVPLPDGPPSLDIQLLANGAPVGQGPITVERHADGVPIAYYPLRFTPTSTGVHTATTTVDGHELSQSFTVGARAGTDLVQRGEKMRAVDTPTLVDHRGVDPVCTRKPAPCPFHDQNLRDALASGRPTAFVVSTPEFCQIGICGPVLELVIEKRGAFPEVQFIHAEVYKAPPSGGHTGGAAAGAELAPAVVAYGLSFEPVLYLAAADGTVVDRLDNAFDRVEIAAALAGLVRH